MELLPGLKALFASCAILCMDIAIMEGTNDQRVRQLLNLFWCCPQHVQHLAARVFFWPTSCR